MALALLYNLTDPVKLNALRFAFVKLGVRGRTVAPEEYGQPVGRLCGLEGFPPADDTPAGGFDDEMLVLCGLAGTQLDALLDSLRRAHAPIALKAGVTEENPLSPVPQGIPGFCPNSSWIGSTRSQTTRATNCANPGFLGIQFCFNCGQTCGHGDFLTTSTCGESACIAGVSRDCGHGIFRLEGGATRSQSKRATNCANPGFLVIKFCTRCGQTCGQADFLTISACGGSACIAGVSRDCGHGIFRLEGGATRSQRSRPYLGYLPRGAKE